MPRNTKRRRNTQVISTTIGSSITKKHPHPHRKVMGRTLLNRAQEPLRRSNRRTANVYASNRITANRLTLPLSFLDGGYKIRVVKKAQKESVPEVNERNKHVLNEDLHALLQTIEVTSNNSISGPSTSRSFTNTTYELFPNASSYYLSIIGKQPTANSSDIDKIESNTIDKSIANLRAPTEEIVNIGDFNEDSNNLCNFTQLTNVSVPFNKKLHSINNKFCQNAFNQVANKLKSSKRTCVLNLQFSVHKINSILDGNRSPSPKLKSKMSTKRLADEDCDKCQSTQLVPQSEWVYSTPDKQNIKTFVFEDTSDKILPAVIRTSKNAKVLYDIKNEVAQNINLSKFKNQSIPIDRRFLKSICENPIEIECNLVKPAKKQRIDDGNKENIFSFAKPASVPQTEYVFRPQINCISNSNKGKDDFNLFLSNDCEESIDLHPELERRSDCIMDISIEGENPGENENKSCNENEICHNFDFGRCRSALPKELHNYESDPYVSAPLDYRHQLLLATQRPSKNTKKIQKRFLLKAKSLSFENTPPGARVAKFTPKHIEMTRSMEEECIDQFEKEFCSLSTANFNNLIRGEDLPHTTTSGALFQEENSNVGVTNVAMTFKYYPRRNFDRE